MEDHSSRLGDHGRYFAIPILTEAGRNSVLQINNQIFDTQDAELVAQIPDPYWVDKYSPSTSRDMFWQLNIVCRSKNSEVGANLSHENIRIDQKSWKRLKGTTIIWTESIDEFGETPASLMYDYEELDLPAGKIVFGGRKKNRYSIEWKSRSKPKFAFESLVEFKGVTVRASEKESKNAIHERIARYLTLDDYKIGKLVTGPHKYQSGTKMAKMFLTPRI